MSINENIFIQFTAFLSSIFCNYIKKLRLWPSTFEKVQPATVYLIFLFYSSTGGSPHLFRFGYDGINAKITIGIINEASIDLAPSTPIEDKSKGTRQ